MRTSVRSLIVVLAIAQTLNAPTPTVAQTPPDTTRVRRDQRIPGALRRRMQREERERARRNERRVRVDQGPAELPDRLIDQPTHPLDSRPGPGLGMPTLDWQGRGLGLFPGALTPLGGLETLGSWLPFVGAVPGLSPYPPAAPLGRFGPGAISPFGRGPSYPEYGVYPGYGTGSLPRGGIRTPYSTRRSSSGPLGRTPLYRVPLDAYIYGEDYYWDDEDYYDYDYGYGENYYSPYSSFLGDRYSPLQSGGRGRDSCVWVLKRDAACSRGRVSSPSPIFKDSPRAKGRGR